MTARQNRYDSEIIDIDNEIAEIQSALTGNETLTTSQTTGDIYGLTKGLNKLRDDAVTARDATCQIQTDLENRIASVTVAVFDGGLQPRIDAIQSVYADWGLVGTRWSLYRSSPIPFESACIKTQLDYTNLYNGFDVYDAAQRQNFRDCTGQTINEPAFGQTWAEQLV